MAFGIINSFYNLTQIYMSCGVLRTNEKPYTTIHGEIPPDVFRNADLLDIASQRFLSGGFGFGDEKAKYVKTEIAFLLEKIQKASFVPFGDAQRVPAQPDRPLCGHGDLPVEFAEYGLDAIDPSVYVTTLSPEKLINAIRHNLGQFFESCVMYHPNFHQIYPRFTQEMGRKNNPTEGGKDISTAQFLIYKSEAYVRAIGGISPEEINETIRSFVQTVFERSKLSCGSFYADMEIFRRVQPKEEYEKQKLPDGTIVIPSQEIRYSTLNPVDLIRMVHENLGYLLSGILLRLNEAPLKAVHDGLKAYDEKHIKLKS